MIYGWPGGVAPPWSWRELGYGATGLEGGNLTLIFPLQAGPNGETEITIFTGAPGRLASSPPDLYDLYLPSDPQDEDASSFGYGLEISPLADPEEIEATSGTVNWPLGWQNRPVLELAQPESQATGGDGTFLQRYKRELFRCGCGRRPTTPPVLF